jgi:GMP synthase (glutamine-hydrolysing)
MKQEKPLLILQLRPEDAICDSEYACILKYGSIKASSAVRLRIEKDGIPSRLDPRHYSAIIVGGSPFDISTPPDKKSPIQHKIEDDFKRLFDRVLPYDIPFLGCCSGNGLLGNYLGTTISGRYREAVGCAQVSLTPEGKSDPLLQDFPETFDVLLGHKEACDSAPTQATLLLTSRNCPVQMFRVGTNVYATQFHPEGDADEFCLRIDAYKHHGYFEPAEAVALKKAVSAKPTPYGQEILRRFVARYSEQSQ